MPQINRQRPSGSKPPAAAPVTPPQPASTLAGAAGVGENMPLKITVWGGSKTGKTRLLSTFPKPILLIGQDGTKSVATGKRLRREVAFLNQGLSPSGNPLHALTRRDATGEIRDTGIDLFRLQHEKHWSEALIIARNGDYQTVALDMAKDLYDLYTKQVLQLDQIPTQKAFGMATQAQWGAIGRMLIDAIFELFALGEDRGISTPVVAHDRDYSLDGKENSKPSEIVETKIGPDLSKSVRQWLMGSSDYIVQTFIARKEEDVPVEGGGSIRQAIGDYQYCLRIGKHPTYITGFRTIADTLPHFIVSPNYEKICAVIEGRYSE